MWQPLHQLQHQWLMLLRAAHCAVRAALAAVAGVVRLDCMVSRDELLDDEGDEDIVEDTREEVAKHGR